jgi:hypothetical protein
LTVGPELLINLGCTVVSSVVTAFVTLRKQSHDDQRSLFEASQKLHQDCEERNTRLEQRIQKLETYILPEI